VNGIFEAALEIQRFCTERRWRFAMIGGVAVIRWGEPQATQDVDLCLLTGFGGESAFVEEILGEFAGRIRDADRFALESRVLLVSASNGVPIDVALAGIPFEEELIRRASYYDFLPEVCLRTCSAEDLVVLKAFAGRAKDWATVEGILARQKDALDWSYIEKHLPALCELKDEPEAVAHLMHLRRQTEAG